MTQLTARLLAAASAQAARLAGQPVTRRRFAAVVAILSQPASKLLDTGQRHRQLLTQPGVLGFQMGESLIRCHAAILRLLCKSV